MATIRQGNPGLSFDDVLLVPKLGTVTSRSEIILHANISTHFTTEVPIISAPMSSVTDGYMARAMYDTGAFGVIHRFQTIEEQVQQFAAFVPERGTTFANNFYAGAAIGVNEGTDRLSALFDAGCRIFCLDIAHAHSYLVEDLMHEVNDLPYREHFDIIIGNVATGEGALFLAELNADAVKVGIGPGAACTTRTVTGFGVPQLSAIMEVSNMLSNHPDYLHLPVIADGGIKSSGDIVKALGAGAHTVMIGKLLAGANESPQEGRYYGMASERAIKERCNADDRVYAEGVEGVVEQTGPVADTIDTLVKGIRSGVSYGGGWNLYTFRDNAEFIVVAPGVSIETKVRV